MIELLYYEHPTAVGDGAPRAMKALGLTHLSLRVTALDEVISTLEDQGVTDVIVGFRDLYEVDTMKLDDKVAAVEEFANNVIAKF